VAEITPVTPALAIKRINKASREQFAKKKTQKQPTAEKNNPQPPDADTPSITHIDEIV
jgi:hypothetical protein